MTAPERIWADQDNLTWVEEYPGETMTRDEVCYIRADVSAARIADLTRQLADAHTALDSYRAAADGLTAQLAEAEAENFRLKDRVHRLQRSRMGGPNE